jgi:lysophospholipase L1-like esterase
MRSHAFTFALVSLGTLCIAQTQPSTQPMRTQFSPDAKVKIALVGDSTVTEHAGWGIGFQISLSSGAEAVNIAKGGRSSLSYRTEGWWDKALALKPDYMLIQFGHNDQPGKGPERETDPATTFPQNMARYVDEARAAGIKPILVTSLARREWKEDGKIHSTLIPWAEATRRVAKEKNVPLIDLHERSLDVYYSLGKEGTTLMSPPKEGGFDGTHLNAVGSECIGTMVADDLKRAVPELDRYLQGYERLAMAQQKAAQATQPASPTTIVPPPKHP